MAQSTFKDGNRAMQELVRELEILRKHNLAIRDGQPQHALLFLAEAAVTCLAMEHFVRIVVGDDAPPSAVLYTLLQKAVALDLLRVPFDDQEDGIKKICNTRNTLLHANYAHAARDAGCATVEEYFGASSQFAGEVETMHKITDFLMLQIDARTGKRCTPI